MEEPEQDDKFQVNTCDLPKNDSDSEELSELLADMSFVEDSSSEEDEGHERPPEDVIPRHRISQNPVQGSTNISGSNYRIVTRVSTCDYTVGTWIGEKCK